MKVSIRRREALYIAGTWHDESESLRQRQAAQRASHTIYRGFKTYLERPVPIPDRKKLLVMLVDLFKDRPAPKFYVDSLATVFPGYCPKLITEFFAARSVTVVEANVADSSVISDSERALTIEHLAVLSRALTENKKRRTEQSNGVARGQPPYGSNQDELPTLELIGRLRRKPRGRTAKRMSYGRIASHLNGLRMLSRHSKQWSAASIARIVARSFPHME